MMVVVKKDTKLIFVGVLPTKESTVVLERIKEFRHKLVGLWRHHSDGGREVLGAITDYFFEDGVVQTTTGGYGPQANSLAEAAIGVVWRGVRSMLHHSGLWYEMWDDAAEHFEELRNYTKQQGGLPGDDDSKCPILRELEAAFGEEEATMIFEKETGKPWPPWGCKMLGFIPQAKRSNKLSDHGELGVFLGWDRLITNGMKLGLIDWKGAPPRMTGRKTVTTARFWETNFPGVAYRKRMLASGIPMEDEKIEAPRGLTIDWDERNGGLKPRGQQRSTTTGHPAVGKAPPAEPGRSSS